MIKLTKLISFAGMTIVVFLVSGCTNTVDPTGGASLTWTPRTQIESDQSRDLSQAELVTPSPIELPFEQYYSIARQAEAASLDQWYADNAETYKQDQEAIARCMQDAGFKWFPSDLPKPDSEIPSGETLPIPRLPLEQSNAEIYGYGRWNPDEDDITIAESSELVAYIDSLGPEGAIKFNDALFDDPGCGKSMGEVPDNQVDTTWYMEPIMSMQMMFIGDKNVGGGSLMSDPDMQELNSEWGTCMTNSGTLLVDDWQADPDLSGPMNAFWIAVATAPDGTRDDGSGDDEHSTLTGSPLEIAIAVADFSCREQTNYLSRFATIQARSEAAWIADHKTMLDQMVATWEQQKNR